MFRLLFALSSAVRAYPKPDLPISYVILSPGGVPWARSVVALSEDCPQLQAKVGYEGLLEHAGTPRPRAVGDSQMPYRFPVKVCEVRLPSEIPQGSLLFGRELPAISKSPVHTLLVGDTGLRVKAENDGTCVDPGPEKLYGIKQCKPEDIIPFDASLVAGTFQNLSKWPLKEQMDAAAASTPDLVIHVGDYFYRQGPCPQNQPCTAINDPFNPRMPGAWGDNWNGWYADFFAPSMRLLSQAPWIALRGNHERCGRGGAGYFLFLDPRSYPEVTAGHYCADYTSPYAVPFATEQFLVLDTAMVDSPYFDDECPEGQQEQVFPLSPMEDPDLAGAEEEILKNVQVYREKFRQIAELKRDDVTNIFLSHHPIYAIRCHAGRYRSAQWTLQQALLKDTLEGISASFHGHVHWFQAMEYPKLTHVVVGNGGTLLLNTSGKQPRGRFELVLPAGNLSTEAYSKSVFGFGQLLTSHHSYAFNAIERGRGSMWSGHFGADLGRFLQAPVLI